MPGVGGYLWGTAFDTGIEGHRYCQLETRSAYHYLLIRAPSMKLASRDTWTTSWHKGTRAHDTRGGCASVRACRSHLVSMTTDDPTSKGSDGWDQ